jgi:hypothetical protein
MSKGQRDTREGDKLKMVSLLMEGPSTEEAAAHQVACHKLVCFELTPL